VVEFRFNVEPRVRAHLFGFRIRHPITDKVPDEMTKESTR